MNTNEINDSAPDFDDHEPGDVNGNVDPSWAKKQKQKAKNDAWREKRNQQRAQRSPRPLPAAADAPVDASAPTAVFADTNAESRADANANADARGESFDSSTASQHGAEATPHAGDRRARGMRRTRRGGQRRSQSQNNSAPNSPTELGGTENFGLDQVIDENGASPNLIGQLSEELNVGFESPDNPNPGAFGDPNRPMDRGARRSRNRNRNREKSDRGRAIREAKQSAQTAQNADAPPESAVDENGEIIDGARDGERLHKVLAQQGLGSRRAMEAMIESGEVEVNGAPAKVGQVVNESDRVYVKRRKVTIKLGDDKPRIMIYHKPSGEIVTRDDPEARDTVFDRLPKPDHGKWIAIGRLDFNTEGLLLFTTSGELANRMMHPRYEIMREYSVRVLGELEPEQEDQLIDGIELDDGPARVLSLDRIDRDSEGANHWYRITINEGRNREVRRMFEHLGLTVSRLIRTRYGAVNMPSWLKRGQYKLLDENDTFNVLEAVGMRSRKKLEKAARFGGARGKLPQGPVGPMRSASEHESIWNGNAADAPGPRRMRRDGAQTGRSQNGRGRPMNQGDTARSGSLSLQQQQFPGFGGASDAAGGAAPRGRQARGNGARRGRGGEVNGNVDPNFRAARAPRGRNGRGGARSMPDFDENGNLIQPAPQLGEDGQPIAAQRKPRNGQRRRNAPRGGQNQRGRQFGQRADHGVDPNSANASPGALGPPPPGNQERGNGKRTRSQGRRRPRESRGDGGGSSANGDNPPSSAPPDATE
jgi:23S rRNA pseudouridine2605 synthase